MAIYTYPAGSLGLPHRRNDAAYIEDRCYFPCNAAFIKGQLSRDFEDFCATGSAFYDYYHDCLCCVGQYLRFKTSQQNAADYLAADFAGIVSQCEDPYPRVADPCGVPDHSIASKVETPFPTATVQAIHPPADSLSVGVSITVPLRQLRPGQTPAPAQPKKEEKYTPITYTTAAWVTSTGAKSQVSTFQSTFLATTTSMLPEPARPDEKDTHPSSSDYEASSAPAAAAAAAPGDPRDKSIAKGAGIGIGCTVFALLCAGLLLYWLHRRRRKNKNKKQAQQQEQWEMHTMQEESNHELFDDKPAQLHSESAPTRELSGREIRPPSPAELPAEVPPSEPVVSKTQDEAKKKEEET